MKRTLLSLFFLILFSVRIFAAQSSPFVISTGSIAGTTTGVVATLTSQYATFWTVIIDGESSAGIGTVAVNTLSASTGTYQPITTPGDNALSCTATTLFVLNFTGPMLGIQVSVTAHTSGTINVAIIAN